MAVMWGLRNVARAFVFCGSFDTALRESGARLNKHRLVVIMVGMDASSLEHMVHGFLDAIESQIPLSLF